VKRFHVGRFEHGASVSKTVGALGQVHEKDVIKICKAGERSRARRGGGAGAGAAAGAAAGVRACADRQAQALQQLQQVT